MARRRPRQKSRHLEYRTLFDVTEEKTFDWWLKGRVTSEIVVSPHRNGKKLKEEFGKHNE